VALASALQKCSDAPHCEYTPPQPSQITGTDPAKADTDGDTRNDNIELNVGWTVALYIGTSTQVFSDPRYADHDNDGLNDAAELTNTTDPEDADTDDDGRNDGVEVTKSLNPLRKDKRISVTLVNVNVVGDCDASTFRGLELEGSFQVTKPDGSGDIALYTFGCNGEEGACEVSDCCIDDDNPGEMACEGQAFTVGTNSGDFIFRDGETVGLKSGTLYDHDDLGCGVHGLDEEIGSVNDSLPFSVSLVSSKAVTVGSGGCQITVNYSFPVTD
jgi:hypothetical protein